MGRVEPVVGSRPRDPSPRAREKETCNKERRTVERPAGVPKGTNQ